MASNVTVNEVAYDFYSLEIELAHKGQSFGIIQGFEELQYTCTINREKLYGRSRVPRKRTDGDAEFDASITWHRYWFNYLVKMSKELGVGIAKLDMILSVAYFAEDQELVTDTVTGVALAEIGNDHSRGPDNLLVTCPLDIMNVFYSGIDVFGAKLAA